MKGTVNRIWHNHREDGSEYWALSVDGQRYVTWDRRLVGGLREGDEVEFAYTQSGRARHLTGLKRVTAGADAPVPAAGGPDPDRAVRLDCLRLAALLLKGSTLPPAQRGSLAIETAQELEQYVRTGAPGPGKKRTESQSGSHDGDQDEGREEHGQ